MNSLNPIVIVSKFVVFLYTGSLKTPPKDRLSSTVWWKLLVHRQRKLVEKQCYEAGLFGDSLTSPLGNSLGKHIFNFAITAMSSRSLVKQLKVLVDSQVKFATAIIAIGTNDAFYDIRDVTFIRLMKRATRFLRLMGVSKIVVIPAFYSSVAASKNPFRAGTIARVEEVNTLLHQVAVTENLYFADKEIQVFFQDKALKANFTDDGVHFNPSGLKVYRQILQELIGNA